MESVLRGSVGVCIKRVCIGKVWSSPASNRPKLKAYLMRALAMVLAKTERKEGRREADG